MLRQYYRKHFVARRARASILCTWNLSTIFCFVVMFKWATGICSSASFFNFTLSFINFVAFWIRADSCHTSNPLAGTQGTIAVCSLTFNAFNRGCFVTKWCIAWARIAQEFFWSFRCKTQTFTFFNSGLNVGTGLNGGFCHIHVFANFCNAAPSTSTFASWAIFSSAIKTFTSYSIAFGN